MTREMLKAELTELLKEQHAANPEKAVRALIEEGRDDHWSLASMSLALDREIPPEAFYDYVLSFAYPETDR